MGQTLDKAVEIKDTHRGSNDILQFGCSAEQGYRLSMEDRHNTIDDLAKTDLVSQNVKDWLKRTSTTLAFFAVYDGHSGDTCADFLSKNLISIVINELEKNHTPTAADDTEFTLLNDDQKIQKSYIKADLLFQEKDLINGAHAIKTKSGYHDGAPIDDGGSTAITAFIKRNNKTGETEIICANTGDSRSVLYLGRSKSDDVKSGPVEPMSFDHKPTNADERARIKESGGYIEFGRVNGTLAVSRAFGDLGYKTNGQIEADKQAVIALPDIKRVNFNATHDSTDADGEYDFLVLACDGVWDVMDNKAVCDFVLEKIRQQKSGDYWRLRQQQQQQQHHQTEGDQDEQNTVAAPKSEHGYELGVICEDALDHCVRKLDTKDNVSFAVVLFS